MTAKLNKVFSLADFLPKKALLLCILLFSLGSVRLSAQTSGMIVNELSNGSSGSEDWVELLVLGDPNAPLATVDLQGWIFDDSNGDFESGSGTGLATGYMILGSEFSAMRPGSIIVIYNGSDADPLMPADDVDDSNDDCVYVVRSTNSAVSYCSTRPTTSDPSYFPCSGTSGNWGSRVALRNTGDVGQVRRPNGTFFHGFSYGDVNAPFPTFPGGGASFNAGSGGGGSTFAFQCGDWESSSNFIRSGASGRTPGLPNSEENDVFIKKLSQGSLDYTALSTASSCIFDLDGDGIADADDLDDDNDGIPDTDERCFPQFTGPPLVDESLGTTSMPDIPFQVTGDSYVYEMENGAGNNTYDLDIEIAFTDVSNVRWTFNGDDPRLQNREVGTTILNWTVFDGSGMTPTTLTTKVLIRDLDGVRDETVFVKTSDIDGFALSPTTNIIFEDRGDTLFFTGTTELDSDDDAVLLVYRETSDFQIGYSHIAHESGGVDRAGYSHDFNAPDLSSFVICYIDSDGDGIPNSVDLDSDNDGIYDVDEAGHAESDLDNDGMIDGLTSDFGANGLFDGVETVAESGVIDYNIADSNGDGIIDAISLDSDSDGCNDVIEAGYTDSDDDGIIDGGSVDLNGLVTGSDGYMGTQPIVSDFNMVAIVCDTDGDGINPTVDLDDDNDGITDIEEGCGNVVMNHSFENQDFTDPAVFPDGFTDMSGTFIGETYNTNVLAGWTYDQNLDGWVGGATPSWSSDYFTQAQTGQQFIDVMGNNNVTAGVNNTLSQTLTTIVGEVYNVSFYWGEDVGHVAGEPVTLAFNVVDASDASLLTETLTATADGPIDGIRGPKTWLHHTTSFTATTSSTTITFKATPPSGSTSAGAALDEVVISTSSCQDSDNDGIVDALDPDSDNDGCSDVLEAGFTDANSDGVIDGTGIADDGTVIGSDGYTGTDPIVTDPSMMTAECDTDGDGISPSVDLDDDNDGIPDTDEGYCGNATTFSFANDNESWIEDNQNDGTLGLFLDHNTDGTSSRGCALSAVPSGPSGGFVAMEDAAGFSMFFESPDDMNLDISHLLDQQLSYYWINGTYDGSSSALGAASSLQVFLIGAGLTIDATFDGTPFVNSGTWHLIQFDLDDATWTGSAANLAAVLSDLDRIEIEVEGVSFSNFGSTGITCANAEYFGLDEVSFDCIIVDTDGDGVADMFDLDSDNDGIYDVVEAGHGASDVDGDGVIDGAPAAFGSNGLFDGVEDAPDSGVLDQPTADSDGDGDIDSIELDSDNDGCNDVLEAGYDDPDGNGLLGNGN